MKDIAKSNRFLSFFFNNFILCGLNSIGFCSVSNKKILDWASDDFVLEHDIFIIFARDCSTSNEFKNKRIFHQMYFLIFDWSRLRAPA